jgi:HlyD family secretion protein
MDAPTPSTSAPWDAKRSQSKRGLLRKVITWSFLLGLLGLILYGLRPRPVEVEVATIHRGPLTVYVVEEGKTRVRNRYIVAAPVSGQMRRVSLKAGDEVKAGETLLTSIEPGISPLLDPREKAQAEARVQMTAASQKQAGESLEMTKTASQFAKSNWERVKKIAESGSVSETDRDNAERDASMRQREVLAAEFALQVAKYELEQAQAALMQMESPGSGSVIEVRAPVSGKVLKVMQESAMVVTSGTQLVELGDPTDIEIEAEILSRDAVTIKPGAPVVVEQWGGDTPLQARVRRIEPAAFTKISALGVEEQRVIVLSDLENPPSGITALGDRYRVEVRVAIWQKDDVMLIPAGALFREGNQWKTFLYNKGETKQISLEAGRTDGKMTEVLSGLEVGTEVLLHPPDTVKDGVKVTKRAEAH